MAIENTFHEASIVLLLNSKEELGNTKVTWFILRHAKKKIETMCLRTGKGKGLYSNSCRLSFTVLPTILRQDFWCSMQRRAWATEPRAS